MVVVKYRFKSGPDKGKWHTRHVRTYAEAAENKRFIGGAGHVVIMDERGNFMNKSRKVQRRSSYMDFVRI